MSKALVVVESPAKAKTIEKFLGKNFIVKASMGHLRDLPKSQFGVDIDNDFAPKYINIRGKGDIIKALKEAAKNTDKVYLASDPDREGEAIAWHLAHILNIDTEQKCRIEFNEITKTAIQKAVKSPRTINQARVDAQQARRILDRIVGYKLSPLLWRKVRKGLSAGRVQSVAVRLICDREKEIQEFVAEEYWTITVKLREKPKSALFDAQLSHIGEEKAVLTNETDTQGVMTQLQQAEFIVSEVRRKERRRNPAPPFTTSSLQQDASRRLGFTARKTMMLAQQLYEGLDIGRSGPVGLITYMRTDSTRVAQSAQQEARSYIGAVYGEKYLPAGAPNYAAKKKAQDAHECIRPTSFELSPDKLVNSLNKDQLKLYKLIWDRFIASQMTPAIYDTISVVISAGSYKFRANGSQLKFDGFTIVYNDDKDQAEDEKNIDLSGLEEGQRLKLYKVVPKQHFTEPPPRYNEATLVKTLEEKGVGRPSTYVPIIETILERRYVERVDKKFRPTELGIIVVDLLKKYFPDIVDIEFTAEMENRLDDIAEGHELKEQLLRDFYSQFKQELDYAEQEIGTVDIPVVVSDVQCEKCGKYMVVKQGRYGDFLACPSFPECRNTKPILKEMGVKCPECGGAIVERRTKRGKRFYGCQNYPECGFMTWDEPIVTEVCSECGSFMVRHKFKNGRSVKRCSNEKCISRQTNSTKSDSK